MARRPKETQDADTGPRDVGAWIAASLDVLALQGVDGVRVEVLAKALGVTKGSFYWHFKDRQALLDAMLEDWRRRATLGIIERLERSHEPPMMRLSRLLRLPFEGRRSPQGADVELSVRLWGRRDDKVLAALKEVDALRLRYIAKLMEEMGADPAEASARAVLAYAYMRVAATLIPPSDDAMLSLCEQLLAPAGPT